MSKKNYFKKHATLSLIYSLCGALASWAARNTTVCLDHHKAQKLFKAEAIFLVATDSKG